MSASHAGAALRLVGVRRRYGAAWAVDRISLAAGAGKTLVLLGASGSGKSTLLRLIAGLEPVDEGEIHIGASIVSTPLAHVAPESRRVGLVFQDYALFPHMTAAANVGFGLAHLEKPARAAAAQDWLARVGLAARSGAYPHELSGGEQQRVALARALAPAPSVVLLDEPFSGLDPGLRDALRTTAREAIAAAAATAVFVTHDAQEALSLADELAILKAGRLIQAGGPRALYDRPLTLDAALALGPINTLAGVVRAGGLETPLGVWPAPHLAEGVGGVLAARPHAVRAIKGDHARVVDRRPHGPQDLLHVQIGEALWRCPTPAGEGPQPGETIGLALQEPGVYVFPLDS